MLRNVKKIVFNYQKYDKFLFLKIKEKRLVIKGFFGESSFLIPQNCFVIINDELSTLSIYFYYSNLESFNYKLKYIYNSIIYLSYGVLFYHMVNIRIKGIGYRFILEDNVIKVYSGNSLPSIFNIENKLKILDNCGSNNFSMFCCDYTFLNFFAKSIYNISPPNRYKEMGIFIEKKL